jgi:hypothetical protein
MRRYPAWIWALTMAAVTGAAGSASAQSSTASSDSASTLAATWMAVDAEAQLPAQNALLTRTEALSADWNSLFADSEAEDAARMLAAWMVGELGSEEHCAELAVADSADASALGFAHALALARCGNPAALRTFLQASDPTLQLKAAIALALAGDAESQGAIAALALDEEVAPHATFVTLALGLLGDPAAEPLLRTLLTERPARDHAAVALARLGHDEVVFELEFAWRSDDPWMREAVVRAMVALRAPGTEAMLDQAAADPSPRIARWAQRERRRYAHQAPTPR